MFDCLKSKKPKVEIEQRKTRGYLNIAIIVGHNAKSQGAINYLKETEFIYNSRIARKLQRRLHELEISSIIIFRPTNASYKTQCEVVANECKQFGIRYSINLHFNSFEGVIDGCECLIANTPTEIDNALAKEITRLLHDVFDIKLRGDKGVQTISSGHRGGYMLYALLDKGVLPCIVEPIFGDYKTKITDLFFENEEKYVELLSIAIQNTLT